MSVADKLRALRIKANLIADDTVGVFDIDTEVHDGVATLTGEVEKDEQKRIAEQLAYEVDGIHEVRNELIVVPSSTERASSCEEVSHLGYGPVEGAFGDTAFSLSGGLQVPGPGFAASEQFLGQFSDEDIESEIRHLFEHETEVDVSDTRFSSVNQMVHLSGTVQTTDDLNVLQDMILNIRGVMGVCSEVSVREGEIGTPVE